jgi:hypothetical protein
VGASDLTVDGQAHSHGDRKGIRDRRRQSPGIAGGQNCWRRQGALALEEAVVDVAEKLEEDRKSVV